MKSRHFYLYSPQSQICEDLRNSISTIKITYLPYLLYIGCHSLNFTTCSKIKWLNKSNTQYGIMRWILVEYRKKHVSDFYICADSKLQTRSLPLEGGQEEMRLYGRKRERQIIKPQWLQLVSVLLDWNSACLFNILRASERSNTVTRTGDSCMASMRDFISAAARLLL